MKMNYFQSTQNNGSEGSVLGSVFSRLRSIDRQLSLEKNYGRNYLSYFYMLLESRVLKKKKDFLRFGARIWSSEIMCPSHFWLIFGEGTSKLISTTSRNRI